MQSISFQLAGMLLVTLLGANRASAEMVNYSYHWSTSIGGVVVGTNPATGGSGLSTGSVAFALYADDTDSALLGGGPSVIPAAILTTTSSASAQSPDSFASPFSLSLRLTDTASGAFGDLTFMGTINGTLTAATSTLTADFSSPLTQQLTLGGFAYSVTIDPSTAGIPAPGSTPALLGAQVQVAPETLPTSQVPEPSSLLLAGLALPLSALACARRRHHRRQPLAERA